MSINKLLSMRCIPRKGKEHALTTTEIHQYLEQLKDWQKKNDDSEISKEFRFRDFYHTMAFVNAVAWIANSEDHHPDLEVGYARCLVRYSTHDVGGISFNDFICAAKIDSLLTYD